MRRIFGAAVVAATVASTIAVPAARAVEPLDLTVTTFADDVDPGDGVLSLREALSDVHDEGGSGHQITLPAGTYDVDTSELVVNGGDIGLTITGAGAASTVLASDGTDHRILGLYNGVDVTLEDLSIVGAVAENESGAGVWASGSTARLHRVTVEGNAVVATMAATFSGGGVLVSGTGSHAEIIDSVISGNSVLLESSDPSGAGGGGVVVSGVDGSLTMHRTRVTGNTVEAFEGTDALVGAGVLLDNAEGDVSIEDSTIDGNGFVTADGHTGYAAGTGLRVHDNNGNGNGGFFGIFNVTVVDNEDAGTGASAVYVGPGRELDAILEHTTIVSDAAGLEAGGCCGAATNVKLFSTIVSAADEACPVHDVFLAGGNVLTDDTCGTATAGDVVAADVGVQPLDTSATPVPVMPLAHGSPALDTGDADPEVVRDARGKPRPAGPAADAGAFEHQGPGATDDVAATVEDTSVEIPVLANDTPGDGVLDPATVAVIDAPASGTATVLPDARIRYSAGTAGSATFAYEVCQADYGQCDDATVTVTVTAPEPEPDPDPDPEPTPTETGVVRRTGENRYETAVAASAAAFSPGVDVVYVATGEAFPDALAGAPLAARDGAPILLTLPGSIPVATAAELTRLAPGRIVVLGGPTAVSDEVADALETYTNGDVTRLNGDDRYATAAVIAAEFTGTGGTVYLATGSNFPDALAGAAAAGRDGGPILLVTRTAVPQPTAEQLIRLAPARIEVLGGAAVVGDEVLTAVEGLTGVAPTRLAGDDRFATSAAVAETFAGTGGTVYLATGLAFPDALSAAPVAGAEGSPILLSTPSQLPDAVAAQLERLAPRRIVLLGGAAAISEPLAAELDEYLTGS